MRIEISSNKQEEGTKKFDHDEIFYLEKIKVGGSGGTLLFYKMLTG